MKSFALMLGFFTRLPVPKVEFTEERFRKAMVLMPLVGLVIGALLVLIAMLFIKINAAGAIRGAALTCAYIFLTGGLHFDGLADTCDGIFSGRSREQSLEIMKDSRIGVFGMLGLFMTGLLYFALFMNIQPAALLLFPLAGRACCLVSASLAPYARTDGMGKPTSAGGGPAYIASVAISLIGGSFLAIAFVIIPVFQLVSGCALRGTVCLIVNENMLIPVICSLAAAGISVLVTAMMTSHFKKKLGGVTGDTFGAVIEVSSIAYLLAFTLLYPFIML